MNNKMTVIERTALFYRLERIGNPYWPYKDEHSIEETHAPEVKWSKGQWEAVKELKGMVLFLQRKVNDSLKRKRDSELAGKREVYVIK